MGDRGNVFFVDGKQGKALGGMYMYSHWGGSTLWSTVRDALVRGRERWGDSQYLARIVFCELVQESVMELTGYGLGTEMGDNGHAIVRIDDSKQRVSFHIPGTEQSPKDGFASWSYEEYAKANPALLEQAFLSRSEDDDEEAEAAAPLPKATAKKAKAKPKAKPGAKAKPKAAAKPKPKRAAR
jgi:hypothetical protein